MGEGCGEGDGEGGVGVKAKLYLHPAAIPLTAEVERETGAVAFPDARGAVVHLVPRETLAAFEEMARILDADEVRICGPSRWEDG